MAKVAARKPRVDQKAQLAAFRKAAREAGCDGNEKRFQDALRTVAKAKPSGDKPKRRADRGGEDQDA